MNRFNITKNGYKFDKVITWIGFAFIILIFLFVAYKQNFDFSNKLYYKCEGFEMCKNPYKNIQCDRAWLYGDDCLIKCNEDWCKLDMLPPGTYGEQKPPYMSYISLAFFLIFLGVFIANHLIHNKGKPFDIEIKLWKGKVINIKDLIKSGDKLED